MEATTRRQSDEQLDRLELEAAGRCARCLLPVRVERRVAPACGEAELELASCGFHVYERASA
jgi:hypothetical protein